MTKNDNNKNHNKRTTRSVSASSSQHSNDSSNSTSKKLRRNHPITSSSNNTLTKSRNRRNQNNTNNRRHSTSKSTSYHCNGCDVTFEDIFDSPSQFINNHMLVNIKCKGSVIHCKSCKKDFMNETCFMSHLNRANNCKRYHNKEASDKSIAQSFKKSEVKIPTKSPTTLHSDLNQQKKHNETQSLNNISANMFVSSSIKKYTTNDLKLSMRNIRNTAECITCNPSCSKSSSTVNNLTDNNSDDSINSNKTNGRNLSDLSYSKETSDEIEVCSTINSPNNNDEIFDSSNYNETSSNGEISSINDEDVIDIDEDNSSLLVVNNNINNDSTIHSTSTTTATTMSSNFDIPHQEHLNIINKDHLINIKNVQNQEMSSLAADKQYIDSLKLIQTLMRKKQSLSSFKDFMNWKYDGDTYKYYTLNHVMKLAERRVYGPSLSEKMKPRQNNLICPSGRRVNVITFDIDAAICDLLSDSNITNQSSTIFDNGNEIDPFSIKEKSYYDDLDQSGIYQQTNKVMITDSSKELLTPLIVYLDETFLDSFSKLVLHPVVITLGIYNRSTRNLSMAWRSIGYLPNFDESFASKKYSPYQKASDFHYCLRFILDGIEQIQSMDGLYWNFRFPEYPGRVYQRLLKFPLSHVVSDAKENDNICGRMSNRSNTTCLARDCDIKIDDSDDPNIKCNFHFMEDLLQKTPEELKKLSFRKVEPYLAFSNIQMGYNPYGINGCTPCEPLHQINGGICERLPKTFTTRLSDLQIKVLDTHVAYLCTHFSRHSDRSLLKLNTFRNGTSAISKLSADEKVTRVLAIYLTLLTSDFEKEIVGKKGRRCVDPNTQTMSAGITITKEEYNQWIDIFEDTLCLVVWAYHTKHPKVVFNGGRNSVVAKRFRDFVTYYKKVAKRKEGMGLKFLKFHQLLHLWWIVRLFSSLPNVDSGRNESHHKKKKQIAVHTQRRIEYFDIQTSSQQYRYDLFLKAMRNARIPIPDMFEMNNNNNNITSNISSEKEVHQGSKIILTFDYGKECIDSTWVTKSTKCKQKCSYPPQILEAIYSKLNHYNHGKIGYRIYQIVCFTEMKILNDLDNENNPNQSIIRACPYYRSERDWFDWAVVDWGETYGELEAQILCFIDMKSIMLQKYDYMNSKTGNGMNIIHDIIDHNEIALIHSCTYVENENTIHRRRSSATGIDSGGFIKNKLCKFKEMEDTYQIISTDSITSTTAVIVDSARNDNATSIPGMAKSVIVIENKSKWHLHFIDYNDEQLLSDAAKNVDNEYPLGDKRHVYEG